MLHYSYDATGALTNLWSDTPGGVTNCYLYDSLGRLTNVLAKSSLARYGYDVVGNLQSISYGNGVTNLYQYDARNRLTNLVWNLNASPLAGFAYQVGPTGARTNLAETVNGVGRSYGWSYDFLYRLNQELMGGATGGALGYGYDAVGNRTNRTSTLSQLPAGTSSYTANDWLASDKCDSDGNTIGSGGGSYEYDALDRLTNANGTVFLEYDGDGNRVKKTVGGVTTYYLVDDRNPSGHAQVLEEYQGSSLERVYNYGLALISQQATGGAAYYFVTDGHGSTRMLTDGSGAVQNTFTYDAYGTLIASDASPQTSYLYCCEQWDSDLGMYYLRARYYKPDTGRFWTMDTYEGDQGEPLGLHKYAYCQADPVGGKDPSGDAVYFVERQFNNVSLEKAWSMGVGHGYLLFTSEADDGVADPFLTRTAVQSFSWHPYSWSAPVGSKVPGRVWENDPADMDPLRRGKEYNLFLVNRDPAAQAKLLGFIRSWIAVQGTGYDYGEPHTDKYDLKNTVGEPDKHKEAPADGIYYSTFEQNCVWWAAIMLKQGCIGVDPGSYTAIAAYNNGVGGGADVVNRVRPADVVHTLGRLPVRMPPVLSVNSFTAPTQ